MPRSSSKSLPPLPLPIVAAHAGTSSDAALPSSHNAANTNTGPPASQSQSQSQSQSESAGHSGRHGRACVTNGCIRTTVALLVFGAYLVWTWPWHREHGFGDVPWLGRWARSGEALRAETDAEVDVGGIGIGIGILLKSHAPPRLGVPEEIQTEWGRYRALGKYVGPPEGCDITQVNILQRHGARYPNLKEGEQYAVAVQRLGSAKTFKDKHLKFLKHYEYDLDADDLTPSGAAQMFESGQLAFDRYGHLVDDRNIPFVRAAGTPRAVESAGNWSLGFAAASRQRYQPHVNVILTESASNTLKQDCPNAADGSAQMDEWLSVFAPRLIKRLNKAAPGLEVDASMVFDLMAMCPFESVAKEEGASPFCALFDEEDFRDFEYHGDVEKYYKTGCGSALGPVQGVGYVNELLARLTGRPVQDSTTHDASREFPLGRALYADFTHEDLMASVFAAIGLFDVSRPLDPRVRPGYLSHSGLRFARHPHSAVDAGAGVEGHSDKGTQRWVASEMVPFSARMATERLACVRDGEAGSYVRIVVNDAVQPLEFCGGGEERMWMCKLEDFVESQGYARRSGDGDFERCYD